MLISRIPAEWKHPVGKPTREDEATRISVTALIEGRPICTSFSHPSKAHAKTVAPLAGVFCEHTYLFEGTTFCEESGS